MRTVRKRHRKSPLWQVAANPHSHTHTHTRHTHRDRDMTQPKQALADYSIQREDLDIDRSSLSLRKRISATWLRGSRCHRESATLAREACSARHRLQLTRERHPPRPTACPTCIAARHPPCRGLRLFPALKLQADLSAHHVRLRHERIARAASARIQLTERARRPRRSSLGETPPSEMACQRVACRHLVVDAEEAGAAVEDGRAGWPRRQGPRRACASREVRSRRSVRRRFARDGGGSRSLSRSDRPKRWSVSSARVSVTKAAASSPLTASGAPVWMCVIV